MVENAFMKVAEMSLVGCYSVLIVLVVRRFLLKCERKYSYYLWFVVFLNLCIPFSIRSPLSLIPRPVSEFSLEENLSGASGETEWHDKNTDTHQEVQSEVHEEQQEGSLPADTEQYQYAEAAGQFTAEHDGEKSGTGIPDKEDTDQEDTEKELTGKEPSKKIISLREIVCLIWIPGIVIILGFNMAGYLRLIFRIRRGKVLSWDPDNRIKVVDSVQTAFVSGMIRPWVYLPAGMTEEEQAYITAHEQYHRKRKDYLLKAAALCITAVHWFNPLAWLALLLFSQDMEVSCDEKVLEHTDRQVRKQYAASLLKFAAMQNGFLVTSFNFGKPALESRIKNVLKEKRKSVLITTAAVIGVLAVTVGLLLRPLTEQTSGDGEDAGFSGDGGSGTLFADGEGNNPGLSEGAEAGSTEGIDLSKAVEISLDQNASEMPVLLREVFSMQTPETIIMDAEEAIYSGVDTYAKNLRAVFYVRDYWVDMAQDDFMAQVYCYDIAAKDETLLYETEEGTRLNEFMANDAYLYWVEYAYSDGNYKVCQYELETGQLSCIATRDWDICLGVSNEYVTWYDELDNGKKEIVIYNIANQEFETVQGVTGDILSGIRLEIVDNGISFFSQDGEGNLYVNRYELSTGEMFSLLVMGENPWQKMAGCFSSSDYIGWFTEDSLGTYYLYNMTDTELYSFEATRGMTKCICLSRYLCVFDREYDRVFVCDIQNGQVIYQDMTPGVDTAWPWIWYQDSIVYFYMETEGEIRFYSVDPAPAADYLYQ